MRPVLVAAVLGLMAGAGVPAASPSQSPLARPAPSNDRAPSTDQALIDRYCVGCHNARTKSGGFVLEGLDVSQPADHAEAWEKVVRKLRGGLMPPVGRPRPDEATYRALRTSIESRLDTLARTNPNPGRSETAHRLNRFEYTNAVRDLLAVEINAADLLPADDSSHGFDNIAGVLKTSPALLERYLSAARVISRLAVGSPPPAVATAVYRVPPEIQQHDRLESLPFGTRGGTLIRHVFPMDAEYDISVGLSASRAILSSTPVEILIDGQRVGLFDVASGEWPDLRIRVTGGPHDVGATFLRTPPDLAEQVREPFLNPDAPSGTGGQAGLLTTVTSVTIAGPHGARATGDSLSRRRIFMCRPASAAQDAPCARTIIARLATRAYRGDVSADQLRVLVGFYEQARAKGESFEAGVELAIRRLLVSPEFLYRIEADPAASTAATSSSYRLSAFELASRLSFFLWSSIPDEALLEAASRGALDTRSGVDAQVRRMLADPRAEALTQSFGAQWLHLRNLPSSRPGETYALAFDETLRRSMQRETELLLDSVMRENRSVLELLTADYTFLNERLAQHYRIPHIQGSHFRRVALPADSPRRGLLGHGSILTVTSPAIRTSPVIRGKWILSNVLGAPPPDPPPDVPALSDRRTQAKVQTMRERMARHRANAVCASCHNMIDPAGFALENFDAIGRWRTVDESYNPIDASGALPDGTSFSSVSELRAALTRHPERFAHTVTERLMTYALGRGLEYYDMPAVRKILRDAAPGGYRMQALVHGIVNSHPFQYRRRDRATEHGAPAP